MKTFVIVVETAILSFIMGGAFYSYMEDKKREEEAAAQEAKENPEA